MSLPLVPWERLLPIERDDRIERLTRVAAKLECVAPCHGPLAACSNAPTSCPRCDDHEALLVALAVLADLRDT